MTSSDAQYALLCAYAEDMFQAAGPAVLEPSPDPRVTAAGWRIIGYLTGQDAILRSLGRLEVGGSRVYYGFLAVREPLEYVLVVRGTQQMIAWIEDGMFLQCAHPAGGHVEDGFYGLHRTLELAEIGGQSEAPGPALSGLLVRGSTLTVTGHSLGAALATYLTLDLSGELAQIGVTVRGRFFASPRPGDAAFATAFSARTRDVVSYAFQPDLVPQVPFGLGYRHLEQWEEIDPAAAPAVRIRMHGFCCHHALCYAALLDRASVDPAKLPSIDRDNGACILPPAA